VNVDDKEHENNVLEECAKKVCKDMTPNWRIQDTNALGYFFDRRRVRFGK
jgi:hypothetical protein